MTSSVQEKEYKWLLRKLNDSITSSELKEIIFLLDAPDSISQKMTDGFNIFEYLEKEGLLSPSNFDFLEETLSEIQRKDLIFYVNEYRDQYKSSNAAEDDSAFDTPQRVEENDIINIEMNEDPISMVLSYPTETECYNSVPSDIIISSQADCKVSQPMSDNSSKEIPHYKMSAEPRGICILISNENFELARTTGRLPLKDRPGTVNDLKMLTETFTRLKFEVKAYKDLRAEEMFRTVNHFATNVDHTQYDCFVCCILTHGNDSGLFGVDGYDLKIFNITMLYEPVTSLKNKPKLFFFQACRGIQETQPYYKKDDFGDENDDSTSFISQFVSTPLGSDFFIGYATPPGYAAWISKEGSWYVHALCEALNKYADRYDLNHISTQINEIVSRFSTHRGDKQIPNPTFTLRKILYFFPEKIYGIK